jgi:hypothetical protein
MRLDVDMRERLILAMLEAFASPEKLSYFIEHRLERDPDDFFGRGSTKRDVVVRLVREYNARNIEVLTEALRASEQANGPVLGPVLEHIAVLRASEVPWEPPQNPFDTFFVSGGRPFIDRDCIRDHLFRSLKVGDGPRVVIISGTRPCGKTWSWHFLSFLQGKLESVRAAKVDLTDLTPPPTPYAVMYELAARLGLAKDLKRDGTALGATQARNLVEWWAGRLADSEDRYILVFDSLDHSRLPDETEDLIHRLARFAADQGDPPRFVLVLLGAEFELDVDTFVVGREDIQPIEEEHVRKFLAKLGEHRGKAVPPEKVDQVLTCAFRNPPADPTDAMGHVSQQVAKFAREFFGPTTPA